MKLKSAKDRKLKEKKSKKSGDSGGASAADAGDLQGSLVAALSLRRKGIAKGGGKVKAKSAEEDGNGGGGSTGNPMDSMSAMIPQFQGRDHSNSEANDDNGDWD